MLTFTSLRLTQHLLHPCLYIQGTELENLVYIAIYVNNLAIVSSFKLATKLQDYFVAKFKIKDIREIKKFLKV
jgi:hypothetical protein